MTLQRPLPFDGAQGLRLADLPEIERRVIGLLRLRRAGPADAAEAARLAGAEACVRLDGLIRFLARRASRPLRVAAPGAKAALADECLFARLVALAAENAAEEAALICGLVCGAEGAREAARLAGLLGAELRAGRSRPSEAAPAGRRAYLIAGRPVIPQGAAGR